MIFILVHLDNVRATIARLQNNDIVIKSNSSSRYDIFSSAFGQSLRGS